MGLLDALTITSVATLDGTVTYLDITIAGLPGWRGVLAADAARELRDALNTLLPPDGLSRKQAVALAASARADAIARGDHEEIQLGLDGDEPFLTLPYVLDAIQRASRPRPLDPEATDPSAMPEGPERTEALRQMLIDTMSAVEQTEPPAPCEHVFSDADGRTRYTFCHRGCGTRHPAEPPQKRIDETNAATCRHEWASFDQVNTLDSPHQAILDDVDRTGATAAEQLECEFCLHCPAIRSPGNPTGIGGWMGTLQIAIPVAVDAAGSRD